MLSEPLRDGCGCDRAFEQIWIDSAVRELPESRRLLTAAGFQAVAHLSPSIKKRSDGDIHPITTSCLLLSRGLNVREPTFSAPPDCWETVLP